MYEFTLNGTMFVQNEDLFTLCSISPTKEHQLFPKASDKKNFFGVQCLQAQQVNLAMCSRNKTF